jgi:hypothetical protein
VVVGLGRSTRAVSIRYAYLVLNLWKRPPVRIRRSWLAFVRLAGTSMTLGGHRAHIILHRTGHWSGRKTNWLAVILIKPTGSLTVILINWPKPSVVEKGRLQETIAKITKVLASAQIELAAQRAVGL